jgi:hypothetical protein
MRQSVRRLALLAVIAALSAGRTYAIDPPSLGDDSASAPALPPVQPMSESELKDLYHSKIFPAVKAALGSYGLQVTGHACNFGTGFSLSAMKLLGVQAPGAMPGQTHTFNTASTSDGKTLVLDATDAQFFKEGSPTRDELTNTGLAINVEELKKFVEDHIQDYRFDTGEKLNMDYIDIARGKKPPIDTGDPKTSVSKEDARQLLDDYINRTAWFHGNEEGQSLSKRAEGQDRFANDPAGKYIDMDGGDRTTDMRNAYMVLAGNIRSAIASR